MAFRSVTAQSLSIHSHCIKHPDARAFKACALCLSLDSQLALFNGIKRLFNIRNNVIYVLNPNRQTNQVLRDARFF